MDVGAGVVCARSGSDGIKPATTPALASSGCTQLRTRPCSSTSGERAAGLGRGGGGPEGQDPVVPHCPHAILTDKNSHGPVTRPGLGGGGNEEVPASWHPRGPPGCTEQVLKGPRRESCKASANAKGPHAAEFLPAIYLSEPPPPQLRAARVRGSNTV